jgi:hypothetical protein
LQAIDALVIGKVIASGNAKFEKDDVVIGVFTWAEYSVVKEQNIIKKLDSSEFPLTYHLGVLGNYLLYLAPNYSSFRGNCFLRFICFQILFLVSDKNRI